VLASVRAVHVADDSHVPLLARFSHVLDVCRSTGGTEGFVAEADGLRCRLRFELELVRAMRPPAVRRRPLDLDDEADAAVFAAAAKPDKPKKKKAKPKKGEPPPEPQPPSEWTYRCLDVDEWPPLPPSHEKGATFTCVTPEGLEQPAAWQLLECTRQRVARLDKAHGNAAESPVPVQEALLAAGGEAVAAIKAEMETALREDEKQQKKQAKKAAAAAKKKAKEETA